MRAGERWAKLMGELSAEPQVSHEVFGELRARYGEPGRAYHTLGHVEAMLAALDGQNVPERGAVELAAWFHDAVYDPRRADNEERSADFAEEKLRSSKLNQSLRQRVGQLILATKTHAPTDDEAAQYLLDADLSILGASPSKYDAYARAIREEYGWVPEAQYRAGRAKVLRALLEHERIYQTPAFHRLEAPARGNLRREERTLVQ